MTDTNENGVGDTPDRETPVSMGADAFGAMFGAMLNGPNPKPDTAEGVASLLSATKEFVGDVSRAEFATLTDFDGTVMPIVIGPDGEYDRIRVEAFDQYRDNPRFRTGTAVMTSLVSFIDHVNRFGDEDSAVFACDDPALPSLTAVLDYHRRDGLATVEGDNAADRDVDDPTRIRGEYRHGKHRTSFQFPLSEEWKAWNEANGSQMTMRDFAVLLEERMADIALVEDDVPESAERFVETNGGKKMIADYATLIELARGLRVNENSVVEEAVNLSSGEGQIRMSSEHTETKVAGAVIKVPTMFFIAIPIFRNGDYYRIPVRLRYRKAPGGLVFWFDMWRHDRAFDKAFREDVAKVNASTEAQIFFGSPE